MENICDVYADDDLNVEDMVLEYCDEVIGNAMADFMLPIDSTIVCNTTKEGCLPRFVNASYNPNYFSQIIFGTPDCFRYFNWDKQLQCGSIHLYVFTSWIILLRKLIWWIELDEVK